MWRLVSENLETLSPFGTTAPISVEGDALAMRAMVHKTIDAVTRDLDGFHFNKAVARIRELTNALESFNATDDDAKAVRREACVTGALFLNPVMSPLAEELWSVLGREGLIAEVAWPVADGAPVVDDSATVLVDRNDKMRGAGGRDKE